MTNARKDVTTSVDVTEANKLDLSQLSSAAGIMFVFFGSSSLLIDHFVAKFVKSFSANLDCYFTD